MAAKKEAAVLRGSKLIKKAIDVAKTSGIIETPDPVPTSLVRKLKLPNGESLSPALKELLAFDGSWLGIEYDEDEAEIEPMSLEDIVGEHFGDDAIAAFGEAYDVLSEDCVFFGGEMDRPACLYVGTPDDAGEYPVVLLSYQDGVANVGGFIPFDVWAAQQLGALERGSGFGDVPPDYASMRQALADSNGDGRLVFSPKAGEADEEDEDEPDDE